MTAAGRCLVCKGCGAATRLTAVQAQREPAQPSVLTMVLSSFKVPQLLHGERGRAQQGSHRSTGVHNKRSSWARQRPRAAQRAQAPCPKRSGTLARARGPPRPSHTSAHLAGTSFMPTSLPSWVQPRRGMVASGSPLTWPSCLGLSFLTGTYLTWGNVQVVPAPNPGSVKLRVSVAMYAPATPVIAIWRGGGGREGGQLRSERSCQPLASKVSWEACLPCAKGGSMVHMGCLLDRGN